MSRIFHQTYLILRKKTLRDIHWKEGWGRERHGRYVFPLIRSSAFQLTACYNLVDLVTIMCDEHLKRCMCPLLAHWFLVRFPVNSRPGMNYFPTFG